MATHFYTSLFNKQDPDDQKPISHLDVSLEHETSQTHLRDLLIGVHVVYAGLVLSLLWNAMTVAFLWKRDGYSDLGKAYLFFAIAFLVCGVAGAYATWYRDNVHALKTKTRPSFGLHALYNMFCIVSTVTSLVAAFDIGFGYGPYGSPIVECFSIGFGLFFIEMVLSMGISLYILRASLKWEERDSQNSTDEQII